MSEPDAQPAAAAVRTPEERAANIPPHLRLTPKRAQEAEENQRQWAEARNSPLLALAPQERERARAVVLEAEWRTSQETLARQLDAGPDNHTDVLRAYANAERQRAEALATLGKYAEAALVDADAVRADEYRALDEAVWRDDADDCACPAERETGVLLLPNIHVEQMVWSEKHNAERPIVRCNTCGFRNVREMPRALAEAAATRARARQWTRDMPPDTAASILESKNLTAERVFRRKETSPNAAPTTSHDHL